MESISVTDDEDPEWYPKIQQNSQSTSASRLCLHGFKTSQPDIENISFFTTRNPVDGVCGLRNGPMKIPIFSIPPSANYSSGETATGNNQSGLKKPLLVVGLAFYNEEPEELRRTLVSLADQVAVMNDIVDVRVVMVSDGHTQMDSRTRKYLRRLFSNDEQENENLKKLFKSMTTHAKERALADEDERNQVAVDQRRKYPPHVTYVVQRAHKSSETMTDTTGLVRIRGGKDMNDNRFLRLSLVLKAVNRRKHNSQEWMFRFAEEHSRHYDTHNVLVFLTDCGTFYAPGCLLRLTVYMLDHPKCVGCTGRQRVMTAEEQDCPNEGLAEKFLRSVQRFDYESSYAYSTGTFSLIGMLPVLPGPCCMMRFSALIQPRSFRPVDPLNDVLEGRAITTNTSFDEDVESAMLLKNGEPVSPIKPPLSARNSMSDIGVDLSPTSPLAAMERVKMSDSLNSSSLSPDRSSSSIGSPGGTVPDGMNVINLETYRPIQQSAWEHFSLVVATPPTQTNLTIENLKLAEDRIPSYAIVTHGDKNAYTTWVDGAIFYFQAETDLRTFSAQRRRWTNGALFAYVYLLLGNVSLLCGSASPAPRKVILWFLFFLQLVSYCLAMLAPAIFGSGLYLGLVSLFEGGGREIVIAVTVFYSVYFFVFTWWHRYVVFNKPVFFIMAILNALVIIFVLAGFFRQSASWAFHPSGIDRQLLQYFTLAIFAVPFFMAIIALDFKSLGLLLISCLQFLLFLPTLNGAFSLYALARVADTSWGNRVSVAGSNFKGATYNQLQDLQRDLSNNAIVGLISMTVLNAVVETIVIYYGFNSWFIVGVLCFIFFSTVVQVLLATIYFIGKHLSGLTFWEKWGCCLCSCCNKRRGRIDYKNRASEVSIDSLV
jgi:cellulose synthase/poly-beta-1,6-N-acetylglucosamine synthase-like glycosyltransferase